MSEETKKETEKNTEGMKKIIRVFKYFFSAAWSLKKRYFFIWIFQMLCETLVPFVQIFCLPLIIAELMGGRNIQRLISYTAVLLAGGSLLSLLASVLKVHLEKYQTFFDNHFSMVMSRRAMELDFQLTEDKNALDQLAKARDGINWYSGGVHGMTLQFFSILSNVLKLLGSALLLAVNAPVLLAVIVVLLIIGSYYTARNNRVEIESYNGLSKVNRIFGYVLFQLGDFRYGKDIRLYGAEKMMYEKGSASADDMYGIWQSSTSRQLPNWLKVMVTNVVRDFANYFYLGVLVITGRITVAAFSRLLSAASTFHEALSGMILGVQEIIKRSNYAEEFVKFMEYPEAVSKGSRTISGDREHTIEFKNVSFTYPHTEVRVLDNVSITIRPGEKLSIVGLNGAGKTTFIKLLCRLYDVDEGEILLDGINIKEYDYEEYMKLFSVVFQDFKLLAFSLKENITIGDDKADITDYIEKVGLTDKVNSLPDKENTMIFKQFEKEGIEPSGGEQQKIAIARALYKNSPVVILDEPTAALDPVAEYEIYRQFDSLVSHKTAVYISHRLSSCKFCDRIAVFSDGAIKELGTHEQLVGLEGGVYAGMFAAQAQYYN